MGNLPKPNTPPASAGRIPGLIAAKKATRTINGKTVDIPKVDLIRALFKGTDEDRATLRAVWSQLDQNQKRELAVTMANEMPGARPNTDGPISMEGKEILDFMRGVELPPERLAALQSDSALSTRVRLDEDTDIADVDDAVDGTADRAATEEPLDDTRPRMSRRDLPEGVDPKKLGMKDPNSDMGSSKLSRQTPLHAERKTVIVEVPGPDGKPMRQAITETEGRYSDKDMARKRKAENGQPIRPDDMERVEDYVDPEDGVRKKGFSGRAPADMTERAPNDVYNDTVRQILEGTRGEADRVNTLYQALRASDEAQGFHPDPRAAFKTPREMAEILWRNADQVSFLEARNPVSPIQRRRLKGDIESENVGSRFLGLPDTTQGQAARMAQEAGLPTSNTQFRSRAEMDILDTIEKEVIRRYGGSGWGRQYDEAGNLVDPGVGVADTPSGLPAAPEGGAYREGVSTTQDPGRVPALEGSANRPGERPQDGPSRLPDASEWEEPFHRELTQQRVGGLPMDRPGSPEQLGSRGTGEASVRKDYRTPEQIAQDAADKQRSLEGKRDLVADRYNTFARDSEGKPPIRTRRTIEQVQSDIDALYEQARALAESDARANEALRASGQKGNIGPGRDQGYAYEPDPGRLRELQDELRQAQILDSLSRRIGTAYAKKPVEGEVGSVDDSPAVSTKGRKGQKADPHREMKDRVRKMAEEARDGQKASAQQTAQQPPARDPNDLLQEAANEGVIEENLSTPRKAEPAPEAVQPSQPEDPGTGLVPAGEARGVDGPSFRRSGEMSPEEMALESAATPIDGPIVRRNENPTVDAEYVSPQSDPEVIDAEFEVRPAPEGGLVPSRPAEGVDGPSFRREPDAPPKTPDTTTTDPAPNPPEPKPKLTAREMLWKAGKWGVGAGVGVMALRAMLGSGDRGGLAQPMGSAANAGGPGEGSVPEESFEPSPYGELNDYNPMSSADRIKLMQKMNSWRPNMETQTAQNWRM
jgi:hypothetical protein